MSIQQHSDNSDAILRMKRSRIVDTDFNECRYDQTHDLQERAADCSMACARCRWLFAPARPAARVRSSVQNGRCVLLQPLSVARRTAETFCAGAPADDALLKLRQPFRLRYPQGCAARQQRSPASRFGCATRTEHARRMLCKFFAALFCPFWA